MNNKTLTSIIMCEYNTPDEQLKLSIESMLNQTYKNFEFIIIDDKSSRDISSIINSYNDERIKLYYNDYNMGLENSLNKAIGLCNGEYIIRMDTDDISYPNRIEKQVNFIKQNPEYSIICGRVEIFDNDGVYSVSKVKGEMYKKDLIKGTPFIHPTMLINKKHLVQVGGYPLYRRCEDYAMAMKMYANGFKGYIMDDILLKYRMDKNRV